MITRNSDDLSHAFGRLLQQRQLPGLAQAPLHGLLGLGLAAHHGVGGGGVRATSGAKLVETEAHVTV